MLTAWDPARQITLALPDWESAGARAEIRTRTRQGELVCPSCQQTLWLHAGEIRIPHFAHRRLSDCPQGRVSEAVLGARRLLYRFFQARIESGRLPAEIVLEPVVAGLPPKITVDLLLRREEKAAVHVLIVDRNLAPGPREQVPERLWAHGAAFRPVFLRGRLRQPENDPERFLLDPTQRGFRLRSVYDLFPPDHPHPPGTLHAIDPSRAEWTSLRGLLLEHEPQVYAVQRVLTSPMDQLLWSEAHAEWVHPGEAEAWRQLRAEWAARQREAARARHEKERRRAAAAQREVWTRAGATLLPHSSAEQCPPAPPSPPASTHPAPPSAEAILDDQEDAEPDPVATESNPRPAAPLPMWITAGLVCIACGQRTVDWQNAAPDQDRCVCRACFARGVRLADRP